MCLDKNCACSYVAWIFEWDGGLSLATVLTDIKCEPETQNFCTQGIQQCDHFGMSWT